MPFFCSICGEESTRICARCTKDACNNHVCERCLRCSDCCECEVAVVGDNLPQQPTARSIFPKPEPEPAPNPDPPPQPPPEPDPIDSEPHNPV